MVDNQHWCPIHDLVQNELRRELDDHKCSIDRHWDEINLIKERVNTEVTGMKEWYRVEVKGIEKTIRQIPWILLGMVFQMFLTAVGFVVVLLKGHL